MLLQSAPLMKEFAVRAHLLAAVAEAHMQTYYLTTGAPQPAETHRGSRAGDPFGDIVFLFVCTERLRVVQDTLIALGLFIEFPRVDGLHSTVAPTGQVERFNQLSMMDDFTAALIVPAPTALVVAKTTFQVIWRTFVPAGFSINCKLGKTEMLFQAHGKGVKAFRHEVYVKLDRYIPVEVEPGQIVSVHVCEGYRHMGSMVHERAILHPEAVQRVGRMRVVLKPFRRLLYSPHVSPPRRLRLVQAHLLTGLYYNMGSWFQATPQDVQVVQHSLLVLFRGVLGQRYGGIILLSRITKFSLK